MINTCKTIDEMANNYPDLFTRLTAMERNFFCALSRGTPVSYDKLLRWFPKAKSNVVNVHIKNLRRKLPPDLALIETVRGYGFRMTSK